MLQARQAAEALFRHLPQVPADDGPAPQVVVKRSRRRALEMPADPAAAQPEAGAQPPGEAQPAAPAAPRVHRIASAVPAEDAAAAPEAGEQPSGSLRAMKRQARRPVLIQRTVLIESRPQAADEPRPEEVDPRWSDDWRFGPDDATASQLDDLAGTLARVASELDEALEGGVAPFVVQAPKPH
jgi:hypothetical protein